MTTTTDAPTRTLAERVAALEAEHALDEAKRVAPARIATLEHDLVEHRRARDTRGQERRWLRRTLSDVAHEIAGREAVIAESTTVLANLRPRRVAAQAGVDRADDAVNAENRAVEAIEQELAALRALVGTP